MPTPKEIIDKVVFGGLYKVNGGTWNSNGGLNDQCYCLAVPVMDEDGNLWMQDTYQLEMPSRKTKESESIADAAIRTICGFGEGYSGWCLKNARWNFYYKNQMKIMTEDDLSHFELICDMHDYRVLEPWEDYRDYKPDDIVHRAILFREHGFKWDYGTCGATLVRKDAEKDPVRMLERAIDNAYEDFKWPHPSWRMKDVDEEEQRCCEDGSMTYELANKVNAVRSLNELLKKMEKEFNEAYNMVKGNVDM